MENKITGNEPAMPQSSFLILRAELAAMADGSTTETVEYLEKVFNTKMPTEPIEEFKWWIDIEAKIKVLKADALITELNK